MAAAISAAGIAAYDLLGGSSAAMAQPAATTPAPSGEDPCSRLAGLKLDQVEIVSARSQAAGANVEGAVAPGLPGVAKGGVVSGLPAFCRVVGRIHAEPGSNIGFEVWMPSQGWDGRLNGAGNGGFAGSISYMELARAVKAGQVGASTDAGHSGSGADGAWAKGHPERVRDYGWRAIHLTAVTAKKLTASFYGRGPDRSYFMSCSNGGRQALMEASRFPEDYDGILAGAPASIFTDLVMSMMQTTLAQSPPGAAIRADQIPLLQSEVLRQCDSLDDQVDGLVADPRRCKIDVSKLACGVSSSPQCFSPPQLDALRRIYAGPRDSSGRQVAFGYLPSGGEVGVPRFLGWDGWIAAKGGPHTDALFPAGMLADFTAEPLATVPTFDFDKDPARLKAALSADLDAKPDLRRFFDRGGKLIMYHGWADGAIPPQLTLAFRDKALAASGPTAKNAMRLFMVPGMQHCFAGPGPANIGQMAAPEPSETPDRNIAAALQAWVETGRTPETIIGRRGLMSDPPGTPEKQRLICAYPAEDRLRPGADPDKASSYTCRRAASPKSPAKESGRSHES